MRSFILVGFGHHYMHAQFAVTLTLYLVVRALSLWYGTCRRGRESLLSVDLQVYFAARVAYVIVPLALAYVLLISDRSASRDRLTMLAWMALGWIVGVAPIGAVIQGDWSAFTGRTRDVLVLGGTVDAQNHVYYGYRTHNAFAILKTQVWRVLQTFNYTGDSSEQYGESAPNAGPGKRGTLFPASVAYAIFRVRQAGFAVCLIALLSIIIVGGVLTIDPAFWPRLIVIRLFWLS